MLLPTREAAGSPHSSPFVQRYRVILATKHLVAQLLPGQNSVCTHDACQMVLKYTLSYNVSGKDRGL